MTRWGDVTPPTIVLIQAFDQVGPSTPLVVHIEDTETGLRNVSVRLIHNLEPFVIAEETFPSHGLFSPDGGTRQVFDLNVIPYADPSIPRRQGEVQLVVTARDYSWRNLFEGNGQRLTQKVKPKFVPPRLELLSSPASIVQGGSGLVRYRVSPEATKHGVRIDSHFFPGFPAPDENGMFALIGFPYNVKPGTPIQLVADDGFGNEALLDVDYHVQPKVWRTRRIRVTDRFIRKAVLPIIAQTPDIQDQGDALKNFLEVNHTLRSKNSQTIAKLAEESQPKFLWKGAFRQLPGSQVEASFADHRNYVYQGKIVDTQDHLGFDLAVTRHYPVQAANDGLVVFADYLGIYGNTIVIDHGFGLQSLYAHLSSFQVHKGDAVHTGQAIAHSGTTGLAAGDHLHFSLVLDGVQVNPLEWWDPHWVQTRISEPLGLIDASDNGPDRVEPPSRSYGPDPLTSTPSFETPTPIPSETF